LVDGGEPEAIRSSMEIELDTLEHFDTQAAKVFEAMGVYSPTLGIIGAVAGGWLFNRFGMPGVTGLNIYSMLVSVVGAVVVLVIYHALTRRA